MSAGLSPELLFAAFCIFSFGMAISLRLVSVPSALAITCIKVGLPLFYFAYCFDVDWALIDGLHYFSSGQELRAAGYSPIDMFDPEAVIASMVIAGGHHVLYDWYNVIAQWLFGEIYASAVFLNVALTFWAAFILNRIALKFDFSQAYANGLFIFFLLHWELLSWTTVANLKDTLVLFLTVLTFYLGINYSLLRRKRDIFLICLLLFLFYWIRFYVPLLMIAALTAYAVPMMKGRRRLIVLVTVIVAATAFVAAIGLNGLVDDAGQLALGPVILLGTFKVIMVPRPWGIDPDYSFLTIAAVLHWIFVVPAVLGLISLWRGRPGLRCMIIYFVIILLFYGAFEELQGARQRIQVLFIYAWAQFHFMWQMLHSLRRDRVKLGPACV